MKLIRRSYSLYLEKTSFRYLFNALGRPHLVYCVSIWCPLIKKGEEVIENVLRRASKPEVTWFKLIFKTSLRNSRFPLEWKKANVVPTHKKGDKKTIKNYRPISLLPICGKIFERLLYDTMFDFFSENNLLSPNQSWFRLGDSCINQLLSIIHETLSAFDTGLKVRGIFLDIFKALDKVWHDVLNFKLRQNGVWGEMINILEGSLSDRKQRVVLNDQF